ncbi:MAG: hypothetical protein ACT4P3_02385 [Betaproteobacteria bacterium]
MNLLSTLMHQAARRGGLHVFGVYYRRLGAAAARALVPRLSSRRLGEAELLAKGVRVRVPEQAIYRFKAFVRPARRGRGIAPFLYGAADELVAMPGRRYVVNCIAVQNAPSVAASLRSGDAPLGRLGYWQTRKRFFALHSPGVDSFGLKFYLSR